MPTTRGINFFQADPNLLHALRQYAAPGDVERAFPHLTELGRCARNELDELAAIADRNPPVLHTFDGEGKRIDEIEYHPAFVEMQKLGFATFGFAAMSHRDGVLGWPGRVPHVIKFARKLLVANGYRLRRLERTDPLDFGDAAVRWLDELVNWGEVPAEAAGEQW